MPDDNRYETALQTALAILRELAARPEMSPPEKLSTLTFTILHTMRQVEEQRPGGPCSRPSVN